MISLILEGLTMSCQKKAMTTIWGAAKPSSDHPATNFQDESQFSSLDFAQKHCGLNPDLSSSKPRNNTGRCHGFFGQPHSEKMKETCGCNQHLDPFLSPFPVFSPSVPRKTCIWRLLQVTFHRCHDLFVSEAPTKNKGLPCGNTMIWYIEHASIWLISGYIKDYQFQYGWVECT